MASFLQQSNSPDLTRLRSDLWSRSDLCASRRCGQVRKCTNYVSRRTIFFWLGKPATRKEDGKITAVAPRRSFLSSEPRLGPIRFPSFVRRMPGASRRAAGSHHIQTVLRWNKRALIAIDANLHTKFAAVPSGKGAAPLWVPIPARSVSMRRGARVEK